MIPDFPEKGIKSGICPRTRVNFILLSGISVMNRNITGFQILDDM